MHNHLFMQVLLLPSVVTLTAAQSSPDYLREVKPLLEHKCYACHGGLKQKAGLRLDTAVNIRKGGKNGPAIVLGKPNESLLIRKVSEADEAKRMPQQASELTKDEINLLKRWIAAGASAPSDEKEQQDPRAHWSYQVVAKPEVPVGGRDQRSAVSGQMGNAIDAFLAVEQRRLGLKLAPAAEKPILLRRVYLDLIGLPPTPAELKSFAEDDSKGAYAKVVDRLLDDPRYGERWGRHWMDIWRYSDWYGRRGQNEIRYSMRHIWRWRDWIVQSLNDDKGYDRMIVEMLAGDEVAPTDEGALAATGFVGRNWYKFDRNVWLFDAVERTSQALLGLTMRCARCHDHKYDPITQEDYYRFRAFFEPHGVRTDAVSAQVEKVNDNNSKLTLKEGLSRVYDEELNTNTYVFRRGDDRNPDKSRPLTPAVPVSLTREPVAINPVTLPIESFYPALRDKIASESIVLAEGRIKKAVETTAKVIAERKALAEQIASIRAGEIKLPSTRTNFLSDPFDKEQPAVWKRVSGKWKYEDGKLSESLVTSFATMVTKQDHPTDFRVKVRYRPLQPGHYRSVGFSFDYVSQTQSQDVYTSTGNAAQSVQAFHRTGGKNHYPREGIVKTQLKVGEITTVEAEVRGERLKIWLNGEEKLDYRMPIPRRAGKFALWVHSGAAEFLDLEIKALTKTLEDLEREHAGFGDTIAASKKDEEIAAEQVVSLKARQAAERAKYSASASGKPEELAKAAAKAEARVKLMEAERDLILAVDKNSAGKKVADAKKALEKAGTKYEPLGEVFPKTSTGRRAALARWIASAENPRTARVAVNHMWLRHFGTALVPSVANFGPAGKPPTHPELLDWLAAELVENGWSMKHLHRLMVMSAAYQRSSKAMEQSADSDNRFYWRMNSRRMEAEVVRDSLLYIAGNLSTEMGGEDLDEKHGATSNRRSLYFRTTPDNQMPMLSAFDLANPNACYQREASVVPHQALTLMNGGLALDQARLLAGKLSKQVGAAEEHDGAFICAAHVAILNRVPSDVESRLMAEFLVEQRNTLDKPAGLKAFPGGGESKVAPSKDHVQRARENLVHALFSHNEFVTIR